MALIGIDLGTTNSLVAVWQENGCVLIPNSFGKNLTPSVVSLGDDGQYWVGKIAKQRLISHPQKTADGFKRFMGTDKVFTLGGRAFRAEELSAMVLRQLRQDASHFLGEEITEAIISVPAYFNDRQRTATKLAGKMAGFQVERIINEPSAAALAYQQVQEADGVYLVFDFGGGTLDISLVEMFENIVDILSIAGDNHLGGRDVDTAIVEAFLAKHEGLAQTLAAGEAASLCKVAEQCKMALTEVESTLMIYQKEGREYSMQLDNQSLSQYCAPLLSRMKLVLEKTLRDAGRPISEVDGVVLVGGSCKMPLVKEYIRYLTGQHPLEGMDPNQAVALGAGMVAGIKARAAGVKDCILTDICPFSLGIEIKYGQFSPIIPRNSALPVSRMHNYTTLTDNQKKIIVEVYQGEALVAKQNLFLGKLEIRVPPLPAGEVNLEVRFTYDLDGILEVDVHCEQNGNTGHMVLVSNDTLTSGEVERRLQQLQALKLPTIENAENQLLLATGARLFEEHSGPLQLQIAKALGSFQDALEYQNPAAIAKLRFRILRFFDRIDTFDTGLLNDATFMGQDDEYEEDEP